MNLQLIEMMRQIERSRKLDKEVLIEAIRAALISASRKNNGAAQDIRVVFNAETGDLVALVKKIIVTEVKEPWREVTMEEARRVRSDAAMGEEVEMTMAPSEFGRIAAQTAKQVVVQRVRESERNAIFEEFMRRQGEIINGVVLRIEQRNVIMDLGDTEAVLPVREQVPREFYQNGDRVKVLIVDVRKTSRTPQVIVSRSHPNLIKRLFETEVPEISDGTVEIKSVAREAGSRTKIAVLSKDKNVDPVGACVGIKGARVQAIVREIRGEKIDIIPFSENNAALLESALQPAKVLKVELSTTGDQATVVVPDDQLSLAIGKSGQNVRLAAKLTGRRIDILSESQRQEELRKKAEEAFLKSAPALDDIEALGAKNVEKLKAAGYADLAALKGVTLEQLTEIPGVGTKTAEKILAVVESYFPPVESAKKATTAAELFASLGGETVKKDREEKVMAARDLFAGLDQAAAAEASGEIPPSEPQPAPAAEAEGTAKPRGRKKRTTAAQDE
jgi:N utilization substance protein A